MIAFGVSITDRATYERCALSGIRRVAEPDSVVLERDAVGSIFDSYNAILDEAAALPNLECLVLLHQDTEIVDEDFCSRLRAVIASDPKIGVVGCVGALDVRSIAWWEGSVRMAAFRHSYPEHGGGALDGFSWDRATGSPYSREGDVDTVDGFLLCLTPAIVRQIRFDSSIGTFHGYDFDFCLQVRERGFKVRAAAFRAIHHHSLNLVSDLDGWVEANVAVVKKWYGRMPRVGAGPGRWRERARRAEAERDIAHATGYAYEMDAAARRCDLERAVRNARTSIGWRITAPVRAVGNCWRRVKQAATALTGTTASGDEKLLEASAGPNPSLGPGLGEHNVAGDGEVAETAVVSRELVASRQEGKAHQRDMS